MSWNRPNIDNDKYYRGTDSPSGFEIELYVKDVDSYIDYLEKRPSAGAIANLKKFNYGRRINLGDVLDLYKDGK